MSLAWHVNEPSRNDIFKTKHFLSRFDSEEEEDEEDDSNESDEERHQHEKKKKKFKKKFKKKHKKKHKHKKQKFKVRKKYKKFLMPLLIAYKLKFFALVPVFIGKMIFLNKLKMWQYLAGGMLFLFVNAEKFLRLQRKKSPRYPQRRVKIIHHKH